MSNLHKLFIELKKLTEEERDMLQELVRETNDVERTCQNLGIKYTDEMLMNWLKNTAHYRLSNVKAVGTTPPNSNNTPDPTVQKMEKIILGDNLDIIEETAKDKGLI